MKDKYREETNKDVYANDTCCGCGGSDGSYSDEYVKWLESEVKKLHIPTVIKSLPEPDEIRMKARELDEKDFAQWMFELQKGNVL